MSALAYSKGFFAINIVGRQYGKYGIYDEVSSKPRTLTNARGDKLWLLGNKVHRVGGPAIEFANGNKEWYINGLLHRIEGPAIEHHDGSEMWFQYGKFHRTDGPAIELVNGRKEWYINGKLHRLDGPAIEYKDDRWFIDGTEYPFEEWDRLRKLIYFF